MPQEGEGKLGKMVGEEEVCPWGIAFSISLRQGRGGRRARGRGRQPRRERRGEQIKNTLLWTWRKKARKKGRRKRRRGGFARRKQQDKRGGSDGGRPVNAETGFLPSTSPPHGRRIDLPTPPPPPSRLPRNLRRPLTPWPPSGGGASCPVHLFLPPSLRPTFPPFLPPYLLHHSLLPLRTWLLLLLPTQTL